MQAEKAIEKYLARRVKECYGLCVKLQCTGINGIPDRIILKQNGEAVFVEMKAPMGRLSEVQKIRIQQLRDMNFRVYVLYNFDQVDWFIRKEFGIC